MVMRGNRALTGTAASGLIRCPRSSSEWRVEQNDYEQTEASGSRTPAILTGNLHAVARSIYVVRNYSV
jgi:hypothetical protein